MSGAWNLPREELVTVYRAWGLLEAQVIKGRLETAGIPALLDYESAGPAIGITIDGLGEVRVKVPADLADEARELIAVRDDEGEEKPEEE